MITRVAIVGTGLIGASIGLALREAGYPGSIVGFDSSADELAAAKKLGAIDEVVSYDNVLAADAIVLAVPVMAVLDWMHRNAAALKPSQLVTDVGSTKSQIATAARELFYDSASFLPGHPMAGKERGGAEIAEAAIFRGAPWIFTPLHEATPIETEWRSWVTKFGARVIDLTPERQDELCAWVSHLPQMVSTAMTALLEDEIGDDEELRAIGGRALREMTRLGSSPYSMWRDIAMTNEKPLADTLLALEQRLQHIRENLRMPQLRDEFAKANRFKSRG